MIDWNRVSTLRDEVGTEDFDEIVDLFLHEVDERIAGLRSQPNMENLGAELHFLKGSASSLGFHVFATQCGLGEAYCAAGSPDKADIAAILITYAESKQIFLAEAPKALAS